MIELIVYSLIGGVFSLIGGLILVWRSDLANRAIPSLLAFAAGSFLGVSFFDLLPEALESAIEPHSLLAATLVGFFSFFILERILMKHIHGQGGDHNHSEHTESLPTLVILGDSIHNFLDGVVIALAYVADPALGLVTALGIAAHEIPQEIGDVAILLSQGWSKGRIVIVNVLSSLATIAGALVGYWSGSSLAVNLPYLLAGVAGIFIYIAACDLIPEIQHRAGHRHAWRLVLPLVVSLAIIWLLVRATQG